MSATELIRAVVMVGVMCGIVNWDGDADGQ